MTQYHKSKKASPKPPWLKRSLPTNPKYEKIRSLLKKNRLHTVCEEARCPNMWECFSCSTATFLIMGPYCTRNCQFCAITHGNPETVDVEEPVRVAEAVQDMNLKYVVVTSVTRDDLTDGGATYFARTIREIRKNRPETQVEVLIPDLMGNKDALNMILDACPDVLNHNIETVSRLYSSVRPEADYNRSLEILKKASSKIPTKSGLMLGLGEMQDEIHRTLQDLFDAGCRMLTLGQYLQPTTKHPPVERYIPPEEFDEWKSIALKIGFSGVASGPFVRSSYHAKEMFNNAINPADIFLYQD
ncbi:MAG TPA: lipoyl synthase [Desulfobacteraceae bacterium]|nr:lipoyl synthase [Desulfobacteraceae bacterium]HPJ67251.1 lipoyl synthase [Desulfobacteraceae bacterium]HPQ27369.1 lipoyl synthase [Desulfobacteraceae bacterium]